MFLYDSTIISSLAISKVSGIFKKKYAELLI